MQWVQESLPRYEAKSIWQAVSVAREQGQTAVDYIPSTEVIGGAVIVSLRRKSNCRACGQAMSKGSEAIQFAYRWVPGFRYRITESFMHPEPCPQ